MNIKRSVSLSLALLLFSASAAASPYLVCDAVLKEGGPTEYVLELNGKTYTSPAVAVGSDKVRLYFDLAGKWQAGGNNVVVAARNMWGQSAGTPLVFTAGAPSAPAGVNVQP